MNESAVVVQKEVPINVASSSIPVKQPYLRGGIGGITVLDASQWTLRQPDGDTCGGGKECVQGKQAAADQGVGSGGIRVPQSHLQPVVGLVSVKKILSGSVRKNKIMPKKYWCPEKEHLPSTTLTQCHWFRSLLLHHPRCFHATKTANRRPFLGSSPTPPNPQTHNAFPRRQCTGFSSISAKGGALHRRRCGSNGNCQSGQKWAKVGKSGQKWAQFNQSNGYRKEDNGMNNSIDDTQVTSDTQVTHK